MAATSMYRQQRRLVSQHRLTAKLPCERLITGVIFTFNTYVVAKKEVDI